MSEIKMYQMNIYWRTRIWNEHFEKLNSTVFKLIQNKCPSYMNEVFRPTENIRINTRNSYLKLNHPFWKTITRQNGLSYYIGTAVWNRILEILKKAKNLNTFKYKMKHYCLTTISNLYLWNIDYALIMIRLWLCYHKEHFSFH